MLARLVGVEDHSQVGVRVLCDLCRNSGPLHTRELCSFLTILLIQVFSYGDELQKKRGLALWVLRLLHRVR